MDKDIKQDEEIKRGSAAQETPKKKAITLGEAAGAGAFGGAVAGLAAHCLTSGKLTFPIFIIAYILILSGLKGWGKLVGLIVFTAIAALVVIVFEQLKIQIRIHC